LQQSPCSSASGRTDSGLAARRSSAASRKRPVCRPILVVRTEVILQAVEGRVFAWCGRVGLFLQMARSCARTPAGALPAIPILRGESDFSPDTVRSTLPRTATRANHGSPRRELSAGRRPRQRRGARHSRQRWCWRLRALPVCALIDRPRAPRQWAGEGTGALVPRTSTHRPCTHQRLPTCGLEAVQPRAPGMPGTVKRGGLRRGQTHG
jgi:hypothetical protein